MKELTKKTRLEERLLRKMTKDELYKKEKKPIIDLDYDIQLKMALQILKSEISVILHREK